MVTHELTVFPDGRVDGAVCVREGDYKSHTLHFVFAEGLRAASAKLMVWAAGAEKPTVYDTAKGDGSCTELDAAFTPVLWQSVGRTRLQLELLGSDGSIIWQSRRFTAAVEEGVPDKAGTPPVIDTSDATLLAADAPYGKIFYGASGRAVGQVPDNRVKPRGWSKIPIMSIRTQVGAHYFQRVSDNLLTVFVPDGFSAAPPLFFKMHSEDLIGTVGIAVGGVYYTITAGTQQMITVSFSEGADTPISVTWQDAAGTHTKVLRLRMVKSSASRGILTVTNATAGGAGGVPVIVSRMCENAGYVSGISLGGDTAQVVLTCAGTPAYAVYRGCRYSADATYKQITIPNVDFHEGFARIDMLDPETGYQAAYFLMKEPGKDDVVTRTAIRADCAASFLAESTDIYDYNANGFGPPTTEMEVYSGSVVMITNYGTLYDGGPWLPAGASTFYVVNASANDTLDAQIMSVAEENGITVDFDDYGGIAGIGDGTNPLARGSLGHGSRWLVFVNGRPVTAPGFLTHIPVNANIRLELVYTCADGIDVGFPYAGE